MLAMMAMMLASGSPSNAGADEFVLVSRLNIHAENVEGRDLSVARNFISCLTIPRFPTVEEYSGKLRACERRLPRRRSEALDMLLAHVRRIVTSEPGSEATLTINEPIETRGSSDD